VNTTPAPGAAEFEYAEDGVGVSRPVPSSSFSVHSGVLIRGVAAMDRAGELLEASDEATKLAVYLRRHPRIEGRPGGTMAGGDIRVRQRQQRNRATPRLRRRSDRHHGRGELPRGRNTEVSPSTATFENKRLPISRIAKEKPACRAVAARLGNNRFCRDFVTVRELRPHDLNIVVSPVRVRVSPSGGRGKQQSRRLASPRRNSVLTAKRLAPGRRSGGDTGAQVPDATVERGVLDLGNENGG
jgi:hypothetical protein